MNSSVGTAYKSLSGLIVTLLVLWLLAKTTVGYVVIYYALVLMIVLLLVSNYKAIGNLLGSTPTS